MEDMANNGIAAHWLYKSDGTISQWQPRPGPRVGARADWRCSSAPVTPWSLSRASKSTCFPDEIYVFTPKGRILELPRGATAVDFAYAVHTDVGNSCVACRINRRLAPLSEPLQSGQTVEILTAPGASPNPSWFNYAVTAKARTNIRHFLKNQTREDSVALGQRLLDRALAWAATATLDNHARRRAAGIPDKSTSYAVAGTPAGGYRPRQPPPGFHRPATYSGEPAARARRSRIALTLSPFAAPRASC